MKIKALFLCTGIILMVGCAATPPRGAPFEQVPLKLQAYQAREFEADKELVFNATLSVLQDMGCIIDSAEIKTGYVSAQTPIVLQGRLVKSMNSARVTAFVIQTGKDKSKARLTFVGRNSSRGNTDEQLIENHALYERVFVRIQEALFTQKTVSKG